MGNVNISFNFKCQLCLYDWLAHYKLQIINQFSLAFVDDMNPLQDRHIDKQTNIMTKLIYSMHLSNKTKKWNHSL